VDASKNRPANLRRAMGPSISPADSSNDPFGSRPEPGVRLIASSLPLPPGEAPEGRARDVQDTATRVKSESER